MQRANKPEQICFVTTTQYQFMIADTYARYINDHYGIVPTVLIRSFKGFDVEKFDTENKYCLIPYSIHNRNIIGQCLFALNCGYLFRFTKWNGLLDRNKSTVLFVFNDLSKLTMRLIDEVKKYDRRNKVILIEEGNNTYSDTLDSKNEKLWRIKHRISRMLFGIGRTARVIGETRQIDAVIVKDPQRYRSLKKAKNKKIVQQNKDIISCSVDFISHYIQASQDDLQCDILFLGQPLYKNGKRYPYELKCIAGFISALPSSVKILIKPHPRDCARKYEPLTKRFGNVTVIKEELAVLPIETLAGLAKIKVAMTIESSAVITLANLFPDVDGVVLRELPAAKALRKKLISEGEELPDIPEGFFAGDNDNIWIPNTIDSYRKIIGRSIRRDHVSIESPTVKNPVFEEIDKFMEPGSFGHEFDCK